MIELTHDAKDMIFLSVPADWQRTEVRGVTLASVVAEVPALGFVRFHLPPRAAISFVTSGTWQHLTLENPDRILMTVKMTSVDSDKKSVTKDVILVKEGPVTM